MAATLQERAKDVPGAVAGRRAPASTGFEAGAGLAFLAGKVLGQYEMFPPAGPDGDRPGRLLLVAPNIVQVERELGVDPADFRLWVCVHEETHRVQFGAVPWLRDHIVAQVGVVVAASGRGDRRRPRPRQGRRRCVRSRAPRAAGASLAEALQSPEQKAVLDEVTAVMSLLEGHADVVMDGVDPHVIPTVDVSGPRFQRRREDADAGSRPRCAG